MKVILLLIASIFFGICSYANYGDHFLVLSALFLCSAWIIEEIRKK